MTIFLFFYSIISYYTTTSFITCDFDKDFCDYEPNEFFVRYSGKSPSVSSGPYYDKTTGEEGFYALCVGKKLKNPNDSCLLVHNIEKTIQNFILKFWYFQYGSQIGSLQLVINSEQIIWQSHGRQKNEWLLADVILPANTFKIEFKANRSIHGRMSSDLAIDDIFLEGFPFKRNPLTTTRKLVSQVRLKGIDFDIPYHLQGWFSAFKNFAWVQMNGNQSDFFGAEGPASDFTSISAYTHKIRSKKTTTKYCAIPYSFDNSFHKKEFYCKRNFHQSQLLCGLKYYPKMSDEKSTGVCTEGFYMMITSDKYEKSNGSFRSRFISPVYYLKDEPKVFYMTFSYNIYGNVSDGFNLIIENYLNMNESINLLTISGPLKENKWYLASLKLINLDKFAHQFRFIFEPFRGKSSDYGSISIDSIDFIYGSIKIFKAEVAYDFMEKKATTRSKMIWSKNITQNFKSVKEKGLKITKNIAAFSLVIILLIILVLAFIIKKISKDNLSKDSLSANEIELVTLRSEK